MIQTEVIPVDAPLAPERDLRVDFVRGLALLFIFIDHNSFDWLKKLTLQKFSFLDAAEVFFFLSGYSSAFAYGRVLSSGGFGPCMKKALRRCFQLYLAEAFLFGAVLSTILLASRLGVELPWALTHWYRDQPAAAAIDTLALRGSAPLQGLLPLYIVFITLMPLALHTLSYRPRLMVSLSLAVYLLAQIASRSTVISSLPVTVWYFNPFAWQLVFFAGLVLGYGKLRNPQKMGTVNLRLVAAAAVGLVVIALLKNSTSEQLAGLLHSHVLKDIVPSPFPLTGKHNLEPLRLVNLMLWVVVFASVKLDHQFFKKRLSRVLVVCGQNSLAVYCAGVVLNYLGMFWVTAAGGGKVREFVATLIGCGALAGVAFTWRYVKLFARNSSPRDGLVPPLVLVPAQPEATPES